MPSKSHSKSNLIQEVILNLKPGKKQAEYYQKESLREKHKDEALVRLVLQTMEDIKENIIIPLFEIDVKGLGTHFYNYATIFELKYRPLQRVVLSEVVDKFIIDYEKLRKPWKTRLTPQEIGARVLTIFDTLLEYDAVLLKINDDKPELIEELLSKIDIKDLQKNIYSSLLAFVCIAYYFNENKNDYERLLKFLEIGCRCSQYVRDYIDTFSLVYNPQQPQLDELVRRNVNMATIIGKHYISKLSAEFTKNNWGRFVAISYKGNVLEKANTLKELDEHIISKGIKGNYYVERLGHEAVANL